MSEAIISSPEQADHLKRYKRIMLGVMVILSGIFGVLDSVFVSVPGWERTSLILDSVSFAFCVSMWCYYDAILIGYKLQRALRLSILLITFIGFPIYAFKSRGRRGWRLLALGILFFLVLVGVSIGLGWLTDLIPESLGQG